MDAARAAGVPATSGMPPGSDHSHHFIATFIGEHIAHHAAILTSLTPPWEDNSKA